MINTTFHIRNRQRLIEQLDENSITFLFSGQAPIQTSDQAYLFTPNKNCYYITGIDFEKAIYMVAKVNGVTTEYLFIERRDLHMEKYMGKMIDVEEAAEKFGFQNVKYIDEMDDVVSRILFSNDVYKMYLDLERYKMYVFPSLAENFAKKMRELYPYLQIKNAYPIIANLRVIKTPEEIENIKKAVKITEDGVRLMMKKLKPGLREYEVEAYYNFVLNSNGVKMPAFKTIAGSGINSTLLHYDKNNRVMEDGDVILFDLGAEWEYYAADVSRVYPVNGRFTKRQKELYNIVLEANKDTLSKMVPGYPHEEISANGKRIITEGLKRLGLIKDDSEVGKYYLHGSGHFIGLDTHDVGDDSKPLKPNMAITLEPGLYVPEEGIGIRVEDTLVITETGNIVFSDTIPKEIEEIEEIMNS